MLWENIASVLSNLLKALLPNPNPIGFGPADALELMLAALLVLVALLGRAWIAPYFRRFAQRTGWCMLLLAALPVALRLALLSHHPVPTPDVYDEFSHLLEADTLRHFRLANPAHVLPQFFETFFVLQEPTYSSIYPVGQGLAMAVGWGIFGLPWAGVLAGVAVFCSLCYWMLRAWTTPAWALAGGLLAVIEFGPLSQWMNSYWGGALAAAAGCLVFGSLPRLGSRGRPRDALLLGAGLGLHLLIRQFESIFLFLAVVLYFLPAMRRLGPIRSIAKLAGTAVLAVLPAIFLTLFENKLVTGSWTTLPEMLSQYQYGVPASLTFQAPQVPHRQLTPQQAMDYKMQLSFHKGAETIGSYFERLEYRVRFYRFFFLPPLYLAGVAFFWSLREYRFVWVVVTLTIFALGTNFFPAFQIHYIAAVTCLFILAAVTGLEQISRLRIRGHAAGQEAAILIAVLCSAHFLFWYGVHAAEDNEFSMAAIRYETWDFINHGNPARRIAVAQELARIPGQLLVFVRYLPQHIFQDEWVYNAADIDASRVVWARDLGPENENLLRYYPGRIALLLEPDFRQPRLSEYKP
jgi:hypothetical protein